MGRDDAAGFSPVKILISHQALAAAALSRKTRVLGMANLGLITPTVASSIIPDLAPTEPEGDDTTVSFGDPEISTVLPYSSLMISSADYVVRAVVDVRNCIIVCTLGPRSCTNHYRHGYHPVAQVASLVVLSIAPAVESKFPPG